MYLSDFFNGIQETDVQMECVLSLIHCPFEFTPHGSKNIVLWEFCNNFMCSTITNNIKNILIPYLRSKRVFPYEDLIQYLYEDRAFDTTNLATNNLFYCLLALEPDEFGKYTFLEQIFMFLIFKLLVNHVLRARRIGYA